jgi:hypothetical protein
MTQGRNKNRGDYAYCTSTSCVERHLIKSNDEYIDLNNQIEFLEKLTCIEKKTKAARLRSLKYKKKAIFQSYLYCGGINKGEGFYVGDQCPDCEHYLRIGSANYSVGRKN